METDKLIDLHVSGVKEASARARLAFFIMVFGCGMVLVTLYNNYFQWNRIDQEPARGLKVWPKYVDHAAETGNPYGIKPEEQKKQRERAYALTEESSKQDARDQAENQ